MAVVFPCSLRNSHALAKAKAAIFSSSFSTESRRPNSMLGSCGFTWGGREGRRGGREGEREGGKEGGRAGGRQPHLTDCT